MDTCSNCGAQLRPGAKFCTTCGARQNPKPEGLDGWGTQPTEIAEVITPEAEPAQPAQSKQPSGWDSAAPTSQSDDPAGRFISALEKEVRPVDSGTQTSEPASAPEEPSPFIIPKSVNWSWESTTDPADNETSSEAPDPEPSTWSTWQPPTEGETTADTHKSAAETDAAGFSEGGTDEVDFLSGDENIEVSGPETPLIIDPYPVVVMDNALSPNDARDRAIALVDELRSAIRLMGAGDDPDRGNAAMTLTEASLAIGDYADVRGVLTAVASDPRDIGALTDLAAKADRIDALITEHRSLADAIERALADLTKS